MNKIPVMQPKPVGREIQLVTEVLESGWWTLGPMTRRFEEAFAQFLYPKEPPEVIATSSGTMALQLSLALAGVGPGDQVIVPALTFAAVAFAPTYLGAEVVFGDIDPWTLCMSPYDVESRITKRTKAIILVHHAGFPAPTYHYLDLAQAHSIWLIEDCAHAAGGGWTFDDGEFRGVGLDGIGAYSFHPVKPLATGDGGAIVVQAHEHRDEIRARLERLRWFGANKSTWARDDAQKHYGWDYTIEEIGYKAYMNDLNAAVALGQLENLPQSRARRQAIAQRYIDVLERHPWLSPAQAPVAGQVHAWGEFVVRTPKRDELFEFLSKRDISSTVHYRPLYHHSVFKGQEPLPVTESIWRELLTIPCFPAMTEEQIERVCQALEEF